ncbi:MAG: hypothetical protein RLZ98_2928 [Pseudomonadota bacterium]|jgi:hypothetical protein
MATAEGLREVSYVDCKGGGQIVVENGYAYVGHVDGPEATTVIDIRDRRKPRIATVLECDDKQGVHAHKVRVGNGLMLTNYEAAGPRDTRIPGFRGGLHIYDLSNPEQPRPIHYWETEGAGVHRFTFDGRLAYLSTTMPGYLNRIVVILDLADPEKPVEVGRWHWPGQWTAGGETPEGIEDRHLMCHHPIRMGDRLYVSYWHAGFAILDISDISRPKEISRHSWNKAFAVPTHTCLPIPFKLRGMDIMLVADEDVSKLRPSGPAMTWLVNISDEANPAPISTFQVAGLDTGTPMPPQTGCHQPVEKVQSTEIPIAWFAQGLRIVDIADPHRPTEVAHFIPDPKGPSGKVRSNDVYEDDDGLIYLLDRHWGLHILERCK